MRPPPTVMPALVTPFDEHGELDDDAHAHNVSTLFEMGIEGFVLGGSNGEGPYLDPGERARLVDVARRTSADAHLMVGVMAETDRAASRQLAETSDADAVLVLTPTTLVRNRDRYVAGFFRRIADESDLPVFLYSVPPNTDYSLPVDIVAELADHPNVVGMKDSSGDVVRLQSIVDATPDDFLLYSGSSPAATAAIAVGCEGVITGSVNYAPQLVLDVVDAASAGPAGAHSLQRRLTHLARSIEPHGVPGVKVAATKAGLRPGLPRLPLEPLDGETASEIESLLTP